MQKSTNQNYNQHQQPICSSTVFSTSTIKAAQLQRFMYKSTFEICLSQQLKKVNINKFLVSSTTMCLKSNVVHKHQQNEKHVQQFGDERLAMVEGGWDPEIFRHEEANMADEEERIRRCVREELQLNLVSRTRNLIHSAATSSVSELNSVFAGQTAQRSSFGPSSRPAVKRQNIPGHWNRPKKTKQEKTKHVHSIPKTVWLLERPDDDVEITNDYAITEDSVLLKAEIDLKSDQNEEAIRGELKDVFKKRYPNIGLYDFEFVKRERNVITTPIVKDNHAWDFSHVKHLCGHGRLYVRLTTHDIDEVSGKVQNKCKEDTSAATSSNTSASTSSQVYSNVDLNNTSSGTTLEPVNETSESSAQPPCSIDDDDSLKPSGASNSMLHQQKVENLLMMFPRITLDVIRNAVVTCASINTAVNVLLQYGDFDNDINPSTNSGDNSNIVIQESPPHSSGSLPFVLQKLRRKMKSRGMREKLKVDPEDEVMDVYSYYKSSDFDALILISIYLKRQPAIDTGGVLRQVFSNVFHALANNEVIKNVFVGSEDRILPAFSNELVVNGFFETLGKMIAHSLVQGGPGFPYLSPTIYWYLATGDLQVGLQRASCADVDNHELVDYITRVCL